MTVARHDMNQKKRMARTLSCLVLAMSGTAMLLSWMNPAGHGATPEQMEKIMQAAADVVGADGAIRQRRWQSIDVLAVTEPRAGAMLAATRDDGAWHFHVGRDGMPVRGGSWWRQEAAGSGAPSILIHLTRQDASDDFQPLQVIGVRALVASILRCLHQTGDTLPVRFVANG